MAIIARRIPRPLSGPVTYDLGDDPYAALTTANIANIPAATNVQASAAPASTPGFFDSFMSAMFPKPTPAVMPGAVMPVSHGMSQDTMIALGLGAVGLIAIVLASRK